MTPPSAEVRGLRLLAAAVAGVILAAALGATTVLAVGRAGAPTPALVPSVTWDARWVPAPGTPPALPAVRRGSLAVDAVVPGALTHVESVAATVPRPIASVTKTMTALVVLEAHPLETGASGPTLTMTAQDVADYHAIVAAGGSFAPVRLGERLTERDLLLGLMLPSANNLALTLARWVDGSVAAFVARLNRRAAVLGMTRTHFADPDGLSEQTTSTVADLVLLGEAAVADPAFVDIVSTTDATLPDGTPIHNLDALLTEVPGWIGIKTGWTPAAGGCLLFAARRQLSPGTAPLTVVGAVLGQAPDRSADGAHPELGGAFAAARAAAEAVFGGYAPVRAGQGSIPVHGSVFAAWGTAADLTVRGRDLFLVVPLGEVITVAVTPRALPLPSPAGATAATVTLTAAGAPLGHYAMVTDHALVGPTPWWKLLNG